MHLIPNFSNFTIVTITISFLFLSLANCLKIPETDFAVPADDGTGSGQMDYYYSQDLSHQKHQELQQDTSEVFSKKALSTRSDEKNNIGKVPEWFKVMISSYSSQPGIFRYFHSPQYKYPYWKAINLKGQKVDFGNNKNKRYMGVEVADFVQPNDGIDVGGRDLGEGGQEPGEERHRKVRLLGSG